MCWVTPPDRKRKLFIKEGERECGSRVQVQAREQYLQELAGIGERHYADVVMRRECSAKANCSNRCQCRPLAVSPAGGARASAGATESSVPEDSSNSAALPWPS